MSLGGRPCAQGIRREIVPAVPLTFDARLKGYAQPGGRLSEDGLDAPGWGAHATPAAARAEETHPPHDARTAAGTP